MFLPLRSKNPPERFPWVNCVLILINLAVFAAVNRGLPISDEVAKEFGLSYSHVTPITLLASGFLHGDIFHIIGNMWFLAVVGLAVEGRMGWWKYILLYFLAGFAGDLLHLAIFGAAHPDIPSIGASGSVMGVMGASLYMFPHSKVQTFITWYYRIGVFDIPMWGIGAFYIFWDVLGAAFLGSLSGTANLAHLGGAGAGFLIALAFRISRDDEFVSEAKATLAEGGDYSMLNATQLKEMGAHQPDNSDITLAAISRIIRDNYKLDPDLLARFRKQLPGILHNPKQVRSAGWILSQIGDKSEVDTDTALKVALEVEKQDDFRLAKTLFDWLVRHPNCSEEDRQMAGFRLAMILEVKEMNFINAEAMYKWLVDTYPMGSMAQMSQARLTAIKPFADRQRGPQLS